MVLVPEAVSVDECKDIRQVLALRRDDEPFYFILDVAESKGEVMSEQIGYSRECRASFLSLVPPTTSQS